MDSIPPVAIPIPYKSQRGWLIAFGVIEILMGCSFLLMILFTAIVFLGPAGAKMPPSALSPVALMVFVGLQYGLMAAVFITGGIGSIRCKNWARILMLVASGLWLGFGLLGTLIMAFLVPAILRQQAGKIPPGVGHGIMVVMIAFSTIIGVLLPAIFLFFYSRKSVRATCLAPKGAPITLDATGGIPATGFPIPLAILGALQAMGSLSVLAILFIMPVTIMFGVVLHGPAAVLVLLTYVVLMGYTAWMVFRQKLIGWKIAMFTTGFGIISMLISYLRRPDMLQLFREVSYNPQAPQIYEQFPQFLPLIWVGTIVMMAVYVVFILYTRKYFLPEG